MTTDLGLFCMRCGRPFRASCLTDLCAPCEHAIRPHQVTVGRIPSVQWVKGSASRTVTASGYLVVALDENRNAKLVRVDARPRFTRGAEVTVRIDMSLPIREVDAAISNAAVNIAESADQPDVVDQVAS